MIKEFGFVLREPRNGATEVWIRCRQNSDGTWYAVARGAFGGCSRDYATAAQAAQALLDAECATATCIAG